MRAFPLAAAVLALLAGCAEGPKAADASGLDVTPETGAIRGVVVDEAVAPIANATVVIVDGPVGQTDAEGAFQFTGLAPGARVLDVSKDGYQVSRQTVDVVAGLSEPEVLRVQLVRLPGTVAFNEYLKLDGFSECAWNVQVDYGRCDHRYTGIWETLNQSGGPPPLPREIFQSANRHFFDVPATVQAIIHEGSWDPASTVLVVGLDGAYDATCDCYQPLYFDFQSSPLYMRIDDNATFHVKDDPDHSWEDPLPAGQGVSLSADVWSTNDAGGRDVAFTQNFQYTVLTTLFHLYKPADGWTFETRAEFPVG